jgi:hypothetical protein
LEGEGGDKKWSKIADRKWRKSAKSAEMEKGSFKNPKKMPTSFMEGPKAMK